MKALSQSSEYAIRAATHLALQRGDGYVLVREMSQALAIPSAFLVKILQPLVPRGILDSRRGPGGGFRLSKPPAQVCLYDIVEAIEHLGGGTTCVLGQAVCSDERACPAHEFWKQTSVEFKSFLATTTLDDLVSFNQGSEQCDYPLPSKQD